MAALPCAAHRLLKNRVFQQSAKAPNMKSGSGTLGEKMRSGALWSYLQGGVGSVIQFASGVVLARLLAPDDLGLFFAVTAYSAFLGNQIKFGIPPALLQIDELEEVQLNSAFWVMQGVAILSLLLVAVGAPFLADFYGDERYLSIMWLMALSFPVIPFMSINGTLLRRRMDFKTGSIIQLKSSLLSTALSILTAFIGWGPYCFVVGGLTGVVSSSLMMYRAAPWHPKRNFKLSAFGRIFSYAWRMHLNNSINFLTNRLDSMILGKALGFGSLGLFARARSLAALPEEKICIPIYQLAFAGFSRIQKDTQYSLAMYQKILCATTSAVYPVLLGFIFLGDGFVGHIYGVKWLPAAFPMKILCIGMFFSVITLMSATLLEANNMVGRQTPIEIANLVMTATALLVGAQWGLTGIAVGFAIKTVILHYLILRLLAVSHLEITIKHILAAIYPALVATGVGAILGLVGRLLAYRFGMGPLDLGYMALVGVLLGMGYVGAWWWITGKAPQDSTAQASRAFALQLLNRFRLPRISA